MGCGGGKRGGGARAPHPQVQGVPHAPHPGRELPRRASRARHAAPPPPPSGRNPWAAGTRPSQKNLEELTAALLWRMPRRGREAGAGAVDPGLAALLAGAGYDGRGCRAQALPGGFANAVWAVEGLPGGHRRCVAKVFSELSRRRALGGDASWGDVALQQAGAGALGARLLHASPGGVLHEWLPGGGLSRESLLDEPLLACVSKQLAQLHKTPVPPRARARLWKWLSAMGGVACAARDAAAEEVGGREPSWVQLEREAAWAEGIATRMGLPLVFCHGDLKPDNILRVKDTAGTDGPPDIRFIDLELAGPNPRGFDIAKLFRTGADCPQLASTSLNFDEGRELERTLRAFAGHYCAHLGNIDPDCLVLEVEALLPLTWLEACVFFKASLSLETCLERQERLHHLLEHRWSSYLRTREALPRCASELLR